MVLQALRGRAARSLSMMLPGQCAVCRAWPAQPLCEACVARFAQPVHRCLRCALPLEGGAAECGRCITRPGALDRCHAAVSWGFPWSNLVSRFKFAGDAAWARTFATLMRSAPWIEPALDDADLVLPMPLARERLAERGFNQSWLLARALAPRRARWDLLLRTRHTAAQSSLDLKRRHANVKGAFAVEPLRAAQLRERKVVLVDDVMTSGATLGAAAAALREAGAARVAAVVLARTDEPQAATRA